jgi:hypothetical protein
VNVIAARQRRSMSASILLAEYCFASARMIGK